jgi:hypothetical protein
MRKRFVMKNKIFKLLAVLSLGVLLSGCGLFKKMPKQNDGDTAMGVPAMYGQTMVLTSWQLDSLCAVDGLSRDFSDWVSMSYVDYETGATIERYAYIKFVGEDDELTYILTPEGDTYKVLKRIVKEEEGE